MNPFEPIPTTSCCPVCLQVLPAVKTIEGHDVFLTRTCPEHGEFKILVGKDAARFFDRTFHSSGKTVFEHQTRIENGCPDDCGLCPDHRQHLCSALIEITDRCNLRCPVCYFGEAGDDDITVAEFSARLATVMRTENGKLDVLQISGGEPTLHKDFPRLLSAALEQDIGRILINTNGLALLESKHVFDAIAANRDRTEVYLQFDGFDAAANRLLRGRDLTPEKRRIIAALDEADVKICLAATIIAENLSEIRRILELAVHVENITGVTFQRFTGTGRGAGSPRPSLTQEDILQEIDDSGYLPYEYIVPLPCSHENCTSISFLFVVGGKAYPLGKYIDLAKHQAVIRDRLGFDAGVLEKLREQIACSSSGCCSGLFPGTNIGNRLREFAAGRASNSNDMKMLRIIVKNFMDATTFDTERARKCCVGVSVGNDRIIPFCVNNIFNHRNRHGRAGTLRPRTTKES